MLVELSISNLAIISSLRLQFAPGFNVLTGETGAGKSIIIDAVGLLLGGRASSDLIRTGCETAIVEGVFSLSPDVQASLWEVLEEYGLCEESGQLILRREISRERRNICRVNGQAVTLGLLQEIGHHLVDVHGQGDHLSLLRVRRHVDFLDRFGDLWEQREAFGALVAELNEIRRKLRSLRQDERELARRVDLLEYQLGEIRRADLRPGEEEELERERLLLANAEGLTELSGQVYESLMGGGRGDQSVGDMLGEVVENLNELSRLDTALAEQNAVAESALYQLEDLARFMRSYRDEVDYDPRRLSEVGDRIELIRGLKRKYGDSVTEILDYATRIQAELEQITHSEERIDDLEAAEAQVLRRIAGAGQELGRARRAAAAHLAERIERELGELSMEQARFLIDTRWKKAPDGAQVEGERYAFSSNGFDQVEFLIAPNPGEDPKPLARSASGGETSRLMLAMKVALSAADTVPTLIFDEIDAGIGGRTGGVVGHKLWTLAQKHQVFCVTHLPQMASYGERHLRVAKDVVEGRTVSSVKVLSDGERVEELAVLLGGTVTDATRQSAQELLRQRPAGHSS